MEAPLRHLVPLLLLCACAPKTTPEDQAFEHAQVVVAAFERGEATPQVLPPTLEATARAQSYMGEYLWEMYAATAAARAAVVPAISEDPRWSGVAIATPAPESENCCFVVHFPARVDGAILPWVTATTGWDALAQVSHTATGELPEPSAPHADLSARVAALAKATADGAFEPGLVVAMKDLTKDPTDDDVWVYFVPTVEADSVGVGGIQATVFSAPDASPQVLKIGGEARTWTTAELADAPGLFVESTEEAPSEAHIFASRRHELPLWVSAPTGLWRVEGNGVGLYATPR
ncbi:MAG: hypothetical protein KC912_23090 [Proteobacteria bacterium]|nr:hypothetical protein [Pseudomonadota bacterium]